MVNEIQYKYEMISNIILKICAETALENSNFLLKIIFTGLGQRFHSEVSQEYSPCALFISSA